MRRDTVVVMVQQVTLHPDSWQTAFISLVLSGGAQLRYSNVL